MEGLVTAFDTALKVVQTDALSMMSTALPVGLGIAGVGIAVRLGMRFFRSLAN
nr:MAG TPA: major coat protein [Inoviridae sp.]